MSALSLVLLGGSVLSGAMDTAVVATIGGLGGQSGGPFDPQVVMSLGIDVPHWPLTFIVLGLIAGALLVAFRQGASLREEMARVV